MSPCPLVTVSQKGSPAPWLLRPHTSSYALHQLLMIATNTGPDWELGNEH